jgi:hypothetical protein
VTAARDDDDDLCGDDGGDEHTSGTLSSSAADKPYQRGPSSQHDVSLPDRRLVIRPVGAKLVTIVYSTSLYI